jgi:hypothetical protein
MFLGGEGPPTPSPFQNPRTPDSPEDYVANYQTLYNILLQIQEAIQGNDKRELHKSISLNVVPTRAFCNVIYEDTFEQSVRVAERMNSAFPVVSHGRTSQYAAELPDFSPDFTLIKKEDCGPSGVQAIVSTIQAWMSRYELTFTQLERYRDNLARVNDVFAGEINQIAANLNNIQKLEKAKRVYVEAKTNIENVIDNFLTRINYLHYEIRKLLQEYYGRKVGWGYWLAYPSSHFLVIIRRMPLRLNRPVELPEETKELNKMWLPDNFQRSKRSETVAETIEESNMAAEDAASKIDPFSCVQNVQSLDQLVHGLTATANESVQIFAFREDSNILNIQITHLRSVFFSWLNISKGWFKSYWYANAYNNIMNLYEHFEHNVLRNLHCSSIPNKKTVINTFIHHILNPLMNADLGWYYDPTGAIDKVRDFIKDHTSILESEAPNNDLKVYD